MNFSAVVARHKRPLQVALLILLCLLIYLPSLRNSFVWDDNSNVSESKWLNRTDGLRVIWLSREMYQYYPLTFTTFWLEHKLWGLNPAGYHVVSLIIHILNVLLFFYLASAFYPRLAFISALLFAVHPIQVETVAWISERKNLLSLFFFLCAVWAYLRFERKKGTLDRLAIFAMFILAMLSKSIAICFIFVPVLYKWWKEGRAGWREVRLSLELGVIGLLIALYTLYLEFYNVGAQGKIFGLTFLERLLLFGRVVFFYIHKILLPFKFNFFYSSWTLDARVWWQWLFPVSVVLILAALVYYREKYGRGAAALFIFYLISIFPVMGFLNVYGMRFAPVADHFSYLSAPALILLICAGIAFLSDRLTRRFAALGLTAPRFIKQGFFILVVVYLCGKSIGLTGNYKDEEVFWKSIISGNPRAWAAYNNLGLIYADRGQDKEALSLYDKAIEVKPDYAEAYNNRGLIYDIRGDLERAISEFTRAIEIDPVYDSAYFNRGVAFSKQGNFSQAISDYGNAIKINPRHGWAYNNRGIIFYRQGNSFQAISDLTRAIEIDPGLAPAYFNRGVVYLSIKEDSRGRADIRKAEELGYKVNP